MNIMNREILYEQMSLDAEVNRLQSVIKDLETQLSAAIHFKEEAEKETDRVGKENIELQYKLDELVECWDRKGNEKIALQNRIDELIKINDGLYLKAATVGATDNGKQHLNQRKTPANQPLFPHYFKQVPNSTHLDVYWVLHAWNVTNPCVQHAIKKLMAAGMRGAKDTEKDLKEARDSITRALELESK